MGEVTRVTESGGHLLLAVNYPNYYLLKHFCYFCYSPNFLKRFEDPLQHPHAFSTVRELKLELLMRQRIRRTGAPISAATIAVRVLLSTGHGRGRGRGYGCARGRTDRAGCCVVIRGAVGQVECDTLFLKKS